MIKLRFMPLFLSKYQRASKPRAANTNNMKKVILLVVVAFSFMTAIAQTKQMAIYYDYQKTQVKERYSVLVSNPAKKHGYYKAFHRNTVVAIEGKFSSGKKTGKWIHRWKHNGEISKIENYNADGKLNGLYKEWIGYDNPTLHKEGNYLNGKRNGIWKEFIAGLTQMLNQEQYDEGIKAGTWKSYYRNGQVEGVDEYVDGILSSTVEFHSNGQKYYECAYVDLKKHGSYTEWYDNGQLHRQGEFLHGREEGKWMIWDANGNVTLAREYKNGIDVEKLKARQAEAKRKEEEKEEVYRRQMERDRKLREYQEKADALNEKTKEIEEKYKVVDLIATQLSQQTTYKFKKKHLYNAYLKIEAELAEQINNTADVDIALDLTKEYTALCDRMLSLVDGDTKVLEKSLKKCAGDLGKAKELLELNQP